MNKTQQGVKEVCLSVTFRSYATGSMIDLLLSLRRHTASDLLWLTCRLR